MPVEPADDPNMQGASSGPPRSWNRRFAAAMGAYAGLALMVGLTMEATLRAAVWVLLAGLAVKTWVAWRRDR